MPLLVAVLSVVLAFALGAPLGRVLVDHWRATLSWLLALVGGTVVLWHLAH
jgi:8-oxo-dGTP pyrophosphatase MutT (NUDIX family)